MRFHIQKNDIDILRHLTHFIHKDRKTHSISDRFSTKTLKQSKSFWLIFSEPPQWVNQHALFPETLTWDGLWPVQDSPPETNKLYPHQILYSHWEAEPPCAHRLGLIIPGMVLSNERENSNPTQPPQLRTHLEELHPTRCSRNHPGQFLTAHGKIPRHARSRVQWWPYSHIPGQRKGSAPRVGPPPQTSTLKEK